MLSEIVRSTGKFGVMAAAVQQYVSMRFFARTFKRKVVDEDIAILLA